MVLLGMVVLTLILVALVVVLIGTGPLALLLMALQLVGVIALAGFHAFQSSEIPPPAAVAPVDPPTTVMPEPQSYPLLTENRRTLEV